MLLSLWVDGGVAGFVNFVDAHFGAVFCVGRLFVCLKGGD